MINYDNENEDHFFHTCYTLHDSFLFCFFVFYRHPFFKPITKRLVAPPAGQSVLLHGGGEQEWEQTKSCNNHLFLKHQNTQGKTSPVTHKL